MHHCMMLYINYDLARPRCQDSDAKADSSVVTMPAALDAKEKAEIVDRLFVVFQDHGYEGASLADLSRATGP